ncbi:MAG: hypothetical protein HY343_08065 [Lentisphaerae bacterium]|nr:hypothetical protein [Lentisphaerota bacterium]
MSKKKWTRPQLIVLGRGAPEENVLAWCKSAAGINGVGNFNNACAAVKKGTCTGSICKKTGAS